MVRLQSPHAHETTPWKRVFFEVPREIDEAFANLARAQGKPKKVLFAELMADAVRNASPSTKRSKKR